MNDDSWLIEYCEIWDRREIYKTNSGCELMQIVSGELICIEGVLLLIQQVDHHLCKHRRG